MTNEEIDEICGRWAGLEPAPGCYCSVSHETGKPICKAPRVMGFQTPCLKDNVKWPLVSSTGDGMVLLMDALAAKGIMDSFPFWRHAPGIRWTFRGYHADSAPMALALAVCELAKAKEQGV